MKARSETSEWNQMQLQCTVHVRESGRSMWGCEKGRETDGEASHALRLDEVVEYVVRAVRDAELRDARVGRREEHLRHREALRVHLQHLLAHGAYEYIAVLHDNVSTANVLVLEQWMYCTECSVLVHYIH